MPLSTIVCPNGCPTTMWNGPLNDVPDCILCGSSRHPAHTCSDHIRGCFPGCDYYAWNNGLRH